jgi:hypothetical protein
MKKKPIKITTETEALFPESDLSVIKRRLIDSSHDIVMNDPDGITYQHSVLCQVSLPYKNPGNHIRHWDRKQGKARIALEAGRILNPATNEFIDIGLPYGTKSRLILTHLNSEALKTGSPIIDVESSLTAFVKRLGVNGNGRDIRDIKDHLSRLSASTIRLGFIEGNHALQVNTQIVRALDLWLEKGDNQKVLWPSTIQLSEDYYNSLVKHAVPLDERALAALSHSPMGLDVYSWLAQRLHRVTASKPQFITWVALQDQFGYNYGRIIDFKMAFRDILTMVHSQYPEAKFDIDGTGMTLKNSPPPIGKRQFLVT